MHRTSSFLAGSGIAVLVLIACVGSDPGLASGAPDAGDGSAPGDGAVADGGGLGPIVSDLREPGTRLQPNWLTVEGERQFVDWWDTKLLTHCTFRVREDGGYRCVPIAPTASIYANSFGERSCTQLAGDYNRGSVCMPPSTFVNVAFTCDPDIRRTSGAATESYYLDGSVCRREGPRTTYFNLGEKIPPTEWVAGTLEDAPDTTGGAVKAQLIRGEDGSLGFFRWTPTALITACSFRTAGADPALRCYPTEVADSSTTFSDDRCTAGLFFQRPIDDCPRREKALVGRTRIREGDACRTTVRDGDYFLLGIDHTGSTFLKDGAGACQPSTGNEAGSVRAGAKVDVSVTFGEATRLRLKTAGRLEVDFAVLPGGARSRIGFHDPVKNTDCTLQVASDGVWRCLPTTPQENLSTVFTDVACTAVRRAAWLAPPQVYSCRQGKSGPACPTGCTAPPAAAFYSQVVPGGDCVTSRRGVYVPGPAFTAHAAGFEDGTGMKNCYPLNRPDETVLEAIEVPPTDFVEAVIAYP